MNKDFRKTIKFKKKIKKGLFSFFVDILQLPHTVILISEKLTLPTGDSGSRRENFSNKNRKKRLGSGSGTRKIQSWIRIGNKSFRIHNTCLL